MRVVRRAGRGPDRMTSRLRVPFAHRRTGREAGSANGTRSRILTRDRVEPLPVLPWGGSRSRRPGSPRAPGRPVCRTCSSCRVAAGKTRLSRDLLPPAVIDPAGVLQQGGRANEVRGRGESDESVHCRCVADEWCPTVSARSCSRSTAIGRYRAPLALALGGLDGKASPRTTTMERATRRWEETPKSCAPR